MTEELRTTLHRLAESTAPLPVGDDLWQRGRAARRRGQALAVAAVLAIVVSVGGIATLVSTDREGRTASTEEVERGAIPSRIVDVPDEREPETDLAVGRGSVAFISSAGQAVVIGASDGRYHVLDLPVGVAQPLALSPDGRRLAWAADGRVHIADLESGDVLDFAHNFGRSVYVTTLSWQADSVSLDWRGPHPGPDEIGGVIDPTGPSEYPVPAGRPETRGVLSPDRDMIAMPTSDRPNGLVTAAPFLREGSGPGGGAQSERIDRELPADLYPRGAYVRPLGWATDSLVLAEMDAPAGSYVEGGHLVLFTSPNRPESEWTYRIVVRDIPRLHMSVAVDLIPDLDGTSSQQLTRDFGQPQERDISWIIGLGVAAAIAVLMGLRWLWRRFTS